MTMVQPEEPDVSPIPTHNQRKTINQRNNITISTTPGAAPDTADPSTPSKRRDRDSLSSTMNTAPEQKYTPMASSSAAPALSSRTTLSFARIAVLMIMTNAIAFSFGTRSNPLSSLDWDAPSLRGSGAAAVDNAGAYAIPSFTAPQPDLWKSIPIVPPHVGHKKVLITGAAGFIGSHVASFLLDRGDEVIVVDEMNDYYDVRVKEGNLQLLVQKADEIAKKSGKDGLLSIYKGDINDKEFMREIFQKHQPKWICHLAARAGVRPSIQDPLLYVRANVQGTTNMLEYVREFGADNVVVASSSSVYGESDSTYFSEAEYVNRPISPYAATKRSGELISYTYHRLYNLPVTNLRFFTVYGPRGRPDMAPYKFVSRITRGEEIEQYGDGTTSRDYTYIEDIVDGVVRAIDRPYGYQIFNLGKGSGTKLSEFISIVEKHVGKKANIKKMPPQPGDVPFTNADVSKANRLLGYTSNFPFDEGIKRTVAWFKEAFGENGEKLLT